MEYKQFETFQNVSLKELQEKHKFLKKLLFKRFKNFMAGLKDGLIVIFKMKNKLEFLTHTIFIWVLYVLMFYFTSKAFADLIDLSFYKIMAFFNPNCCWVSIFYFSMDDLLAFTF